MNADGRRKISRDDVTQVLKQKARKNKDKEKILITVNSVKSDIETEKDIEISNRAIRDKGICNQGYYMKKWPDYFSYRQSGNPNRWGMIMKNPAEFLDEVEE